MANIEKVFICKKTITLTFFCKGIFLVPQEHSNIFNTMLWQARSMRDCAKWKIDLRREKIQCTVNACTKSWIDDSSVPQSNNGTLYGSYRLSDINIIVDRYILYDQVHCISRNLPLNPSVPPSIMGFIVLLSSSPKCL